MSTLRDDYVIRLEEENDELRERVRQLEAAIGMTIEAPLQIGFTRHEAALFGVLMTRDLVGRNLAMLTLYGDRADDAPAEKIVDVFVCKVRRKLKPFDVDIETIWGQGWRLTPEARAKAQRLIEQSRSVHQPITD